MNEKNNGKEEGKKEGRKSERKGKIGKKGETREREWGGRND